MRLVWSAVARDDRRRIASYLTERNPVAALRVVEGLLSAAESLQRLPERGRPGRVVGTRELAAVLPYLLIYEVDRKAGIVRIVRVWHTARDGES